MALPDLASINLTKRIAITDRDDVVDVTNMFDFENDETNDPAECVWFVAGPDPNTGGWFQARHDAFEYQGRAN